MKKPLARYGRLLRQYWWLLVAGALIPAVLVRYLLSLRPDTYQAKATLIVGTSLQSPQPDPWQLNLANTLASAYARLAKEGPVMQAVIERLGLERRPDRLAQQVTALVYPDAQLLEIRVVDTEARVAALIANVVADELIRRSPVSSEDQAQRQAFIREQLLDLETRVKRLDGEISALRASLSELTSAAELKEAQERLTALEDAKSSLQDTYASLLRSYQTAIPNTISVFEPASEPFEPLPRQDNLIAVVTAIAGLLLSFTGLALTEYLDDAVRWEGEAMQELLGIPVLGVVTRVPHLPHASLVEQFDLLSPSAELIRVLRTNILLAAGDKSLNTLLVSSPTLRDGKTFTTALLGLTMAAAGQRVIMVDADMRKPALHKAFDLPNPCGLAELLAGRTPLARSGVPKGVLETGMENLYLLPAGKPPLDPSLLLTSQRLRQLFALLRKHADLILVDSPPVLAVPDAEILASVMDAVVLVVNSGVTSAARVMSAKSRLIDRAEVNLLGVVFNHVKAGGKYYYYRSTGLKPRRHRRWPISSALQKLRLGDRRLKADDHSTLTLREAADEMGVSLATIRRWCEVGRLPATRNGLRWTVSRADLSRVSSAGGEQRHLEYLTQSRRLGSDGSPIDTPEKDLREKE